MSRPSRRHPVDKHKWATVRSYVVAEGGRYVVDYAPSNVLLVVHAEKTDDHPCKQYAPLAKQHHRHVTVKDEDDWSGEDSSSLTIILDCTTINNEETMQVELCTVGLGPVSKPVSRTVEKFNPWEITVLAPTRSATIVVSKLLKDQYFGRRVAGVVMCHPEFPLGFVRSQFRNKVVTDKPTIAVVRGSLNITAATAVITISRTATTIGAPQFKPLFSVQWEDAFPNLRKIVCEIDEKAARNGLKILLGETYGGGRESGNMDTDQEGETEEEDDLVPNIRRMSLEEGESEGDEEEEGQEFGEEWQEYECDIKPGRNVNFAEIEFYLDPRTKQVERLINPVHI